MADFAFIKSSAGLLPCEQASRDWFDRLRFGVTVRGKMVVPRNPKFQRKFFAMLHTAYDNHEWPQIETQYGTAQCTFEQFRKYVTIKAGFFEMGATPQGEPRAEAKSIAFGNMDEAEFERVYSSVLDIILAEFLSNWTHGDMDNAVKQMLDFA